VAQTYHIARLSPLRRLGDSSEADLALGRRLSHSGVDETGIGANQVIASGLTEGTWVLLPGKFAARGLGQSGGRNRTGQFSTTHHASGCVQRGSLSPIGWRSPRPDDPMRLVKRHGVGRRFPLSVLESLGIIENVAGRRVQVRQHQRT